MSTTSAIIKQVESPGYAVSVHEIPSSLPGTVGAFVELHAVKVPEGEPVHIARSHDGNCERKTYAGTCEPAAMWEPIGKASVSTIRPRRPRRDYCRRPKAPQAIPNTVHTKDESTAVIRS